MYHTLNETRGLKLETIVSRCNPEVKLHLIFRLDEMSGRKNLVAESEFLQVSALKIDSGEFFRPHRHILKDLVHSETIAQESWVVISGQIQVTYYDLDDSVIEKRDLFPGDCSITLQGGHRYEAIGESLVYEFKSGPYEGQQRDKVMIPESTHSTLS